MKYLTIFYRRFLAIDRRLLLLTITTLLTNTQTGFAQDLPVVEATAPIQLNANLPTDADVTDFQISPDNQRAVYIADQNDDDVFELFSVRMDGSATPIRLSLDNPISGGDVLRIVGFSADGQRVVYSADQGTDGMDELLSASLDGNSRITLTPNFGAGNTFTSLALTPDKNRLIYVAATSGVTFSSRHMFSVPVIGGSVVRLSNNFALNAFLTASDADFSRDSSKVIYRVTMGGLQQLHIANTDGSGTALRLDADGPGEDRVFSYEISNDNNRIVYQADQNIDDQFELFSVAATGGPVVRLNSSLPAGTEVRDFRMNTLNSNFVYYTAEQAAIGRQEMFSVNITGGTPTRISPAVSGGSTTVFRSNNGNGGIISYIFLDRTPFPSVFTFRGVSQLNNNDLLISDSVTSSDFFVVLESFSGRFVTFLSRVFGSNQSRLISLQLAENATQNRVLISEAVSNTRSNYLRHISTDERLVAYTTDDLVDANLQNLFVTSLQFGEPVRLNPDLAIGTEIVQTLTSDDAGFALYRADQDSVGQFNLYASAITLNEPEPEIDDFCVPIKATSGAIAVICL